MKSRFMLAITVDVECDKDTSWLVRRPLDFAGVRRGIGAVLAPLLHEYGARATYLVSPEVLRDGDSVAVLNGLGDCELGTHLHPEFVWSSSGVLSTEMVASHLRAEEEARDLAELTRLFTDVTGRVPLSYRAGRFGASARSLAALEALGYRVDTSVTPHKYWMEGLDFRGAPGQPYYPSAHDIKTPGPPRRVLEVPVSLRPSPAPEWLRSVARQAARTRLQPARRLSKWARGPAMLRPGWSSLAMLRRFVVEATREPGCVLNMMFHNIDLVAGCSPNAGSTEAVKGTLRGLRTVLDATVSAGGEFATLSSVRDRWVQETSEAALE